MRKSPSSFYHQLCVCVSVYVRTLIRKLPHTVTKTKQKKKKRHLVVMFSVNAKLFSADAE